jgi:ribosomal-protein-alanine N-acetyltransferase
VSAQPQAQQRMLLPMTPLQLDAVMAIEAAAYAFPWSRGNFVDSLASGYEARVLYDGSGRILGYFVAMAGVDELHLLNITVAPQAQHQGHALHMLDALEALCRVRKANQLWLEVRQSNARARAIYLRRGFVHVGVRKGYYPAPQGQREDAVVMSLAVAELRDGMD